MPASAQAQEHSVPIRALGKLGLAVEGTFSAPGGLTGYIGQAGGETTVVYVTADGAQVITGPMLDAAGNNLTERHIQRHRLAGQSQAVWNSLEAAAWVREGGDDAARVVYVITDANCGFCNQFWQESQPYIGDAAQLRHVLVGIMAPTSLSKAARILAADDPTAALVEHKERQYRDGGIEPLEPVPEAVKARIQANEALMREWGVHVTPTIIYKDRNGDVQTFMGMPGAGLMAEDIYQQPEQARTRPP